MVMCVYAHDVCACMYVYIGRVTHNVRWRATHVVKNVCNFSATMLLDVGHLLGRLRSTSATKLRLR